MEFRGYRLVRVCCRSRMIAARCARSKRTLENNGDLMTAVSNIGRAADSFMASSARPRSKPGESHGYT